MPRNLGALPRGQMGIEVGELAVGPLIQHGSFGFAVAAFAQGFGAGRQRRHRFFERQILHHTVIDMPR